MLGFEYKNIYYYNKKGKLINERSYINYEHFNKVKKEKIKRGLIMGNQLKKIKWYFVDYPKNIFNGFTYDEKDKWNGWSKVYIDDNTFQQLKTLELFKASAEDLEELERLEKYKPKTQGLYNMIGYCIIIK